jgi:hypothetical protein
LESQKQIVEFSQVHFSNETATVVAHDHPRFPGERVLVTSRVLRYGEDEFETKNTIYRRKKVADGA